MDSKKFYESVKRFEAKIVDKEYVDRLDAKIDSCENESKKLSDIEACIIVLNCEYLSEEFNYKAKQMIGSICTESRVLQSKIDVLKKERAVAMIQFNDFSVGFKQYVHSCLTAYRIDKETIDIRNDRLKRHIRELRRVRKDIDGTIQGFKNRVSNELFDEMNDSLKYVDDLYSKLQDRMEK